MLHQTDVFLSSTDIGPQEVSDQHVLHSQSSTHQGSHSGESTDIANSARSLHQKQVELSLEPSQILSTNKQEHKPQEHKGPSQGEEHQHGSGRRTESLPRGLKLEKCSSGRTPPPQESCGAQFSALEHASKNDCEIIEPVIAHQNSVHSDASTVNIPISGLVEMPKSTEAPITQNLEHMNEHHLKSQIPEYLAAEGNSTMQGSIPEYTTKESPGVDCEEALQRDDLQMVKTPCLGALMHTAPHGSNNGDTQGSQGINKCTDESSMTTLLEVKKFDKENTISTPSSHPVSPLMKEKVAMEQQLSFEGNLPEEVKSSSATTSMQDEFLQDGVEVPEDNR